jgi:ubiquinone/menaquinone biosynthesis C-methylase UbiE
MGRPVRLVDYALGIEGVALLRTLFDGVPPLERVQELARLLTDEELGRLALDFPERSAAAGYAEWSAFYDDMPNPLIAGEEAEMRRVLQDVPPGKALDAACGTGRMTGVLQSLGHTVVGVDGSPEMLAISRAKLPAVDLRSAVLEELPFEDASFDLVTCCLALAHFEKLDPPVRELARVTKPGGRVIISDIHPFAVLLAGQASYMGPAGVAGVIRQHVHLPSAYLASFEAAGLEVLRCIEPLHSEVSVSKTPSYGVIPEATREALIGLPVAIVWELQRA